MLLITKTFLTILLLSILLMGPTPLPSNWPPSPEELARTSTWAVAAERFQQSAHESLACDACHDDNLPDDASTPQPDAVRLTTATTDPFDYEKCRTCHSQAFAASEQGVHAQALADPGLSEAAPACGHCHSAHDASAGTRLEQLTNVNETCGRCHETALESYLHNEHGRAALLGLEQTATCSDCHGAHTVLALHETGEALTACLRCHPEADEAFVSRSHTHSELGSDPDDPRSADTRPCQDCHADARVDEWVQADRTPVYVDPVPYQDTLHSDIACIACHTDLAAIPHQAQKAVVCADCHHTILTHVNMGAPHMSTDCAACHMEDLAVSFDESTGRVVLASKDSAGAALDRTDHTIVQEAGCDKCHVAGNAVGAPASTLPARSVLCMLCHDASPTISVALLDSTPVKTDYVSIIALLIFCVGMALNLSLYFSGSVPGHPGITTWQKIGYVAADTVHLIFSRRIFRFLGGAVADGIFQRRVLQESVGRWAIHALIYLPFLARLGLGFFTWLSQALWPAAGWTQILSNKDAPGVAFAYDFLTALMFLGVLLALVRRFVLRDRRLPNMGQDKIAIGLLGAILLVGIITEGIRLLSAQTPQDMAVYSFLGYAVAALLRPLNLVWTSFYPVIWYAHALLVAALIAYLPFSKFMHILAGPLIASLDAARKGKR